MAPRLDELTLAQLHRLLVCVPTEMLAKWSARLNVYQWPDDCPIHPPAGYREFMPDDVYMALVQPLWCYCHWRCPVEATSRAWWVHILGRSEVEWRAWWDYGRPPWTRETQAWLERERPQTLEECADARP